MNEFPNSQGELPAEEEFIARLAREMAALGEIPSGEAMRREDGSTSENAAGDETKANKVSQSAGADAALPFQNNADETPAQMGESASPPAIGELSEKLLHRLLKRCYAPNPLCREVPIGRYVADCRVGGRVVEIQTGGAWGLLPKLTAFLDEGLAVTLALPLAREKILRWVDPESGEVSPARRSGRHLRGVDALALLSPLRQILLREGFSVELLFFRFEEFRLRCGYARDGKKGSTRIERYPRELLARRVLARPGDYARLAREELLLPAAFTGGEFARAARLRSRQGYAALHTLEAVGVIREIGSRGRAREYAMVDAGLPGGQ